MLIYLNVNSAFASVASLDFGAFMGSLQKMANRQLFVHILIPEFLLNDSA